MKGKLILFFACLSLSLAANTTRVLFIGNSYTYVNNLPLLLYNLALANGDTIIYDSSAPGGYTFQQHTSNATTLQKINAQPWDYVVLQEQSQIPSFPPSQVSTDCLPYAQQLVSLIRQNDSCSTPLFYMTWGRKYGDASNCANYTPLCTYEGMSQRLRESYLQMCDDNLAMASPVGVAFYNSRLADSTLNLYQSDNSHPSLAGSYLAACTFYASIFHQSPIGNTYLAGLTQSTATFLQNIASHTVLDSLPVWRNGTFLADASFTFQAIGNNVQFTSHDVYSNANHIWFFGDGNTDNVVLPQHTYANGTYQVTHVVNRFCSSDSVTQTISIGGQTNISAVPLFASKDRILSIHDIFGHELHTQELGDLTAGTYVITYQSNQILYRRKFVVI